MSKKLTVSIPDWVEMGIVDRRPITNKSEWVTELLIRGYEAKKADQVRWHPKSLMEDDICFEKEKEVAAKQQVIWNSILEKAEPKSLNTKRLEARRASGPKLSLVQSFIPDFSSLIEQERPCVALED